MKILCFSMLVSLSVAGLASEPPPRDLYDSGGTVCLKIAEDGIVADAFMGKSTGSQRKDKRFIAWARQMEWPAQKEPGEERGHWFPMSLMSRVPDGDIAKVDCESLALKR